MHQGHTQPREDLLAEAISSRPPVEWEPTGDARADLTLLISTLASELNERAHLMPSFIAAAQTHDQVGDAVRTKIGGHIRSAFTELLADLLGEDSPHVGLLADLIPGLLMVRTGMLGEQVEPEKLAAELLALVDATR